MPLPPEMVYITVFPLRYILCFAHSQLHTHIQFLCPDFQSQICLILVIKPSTYQYQSAQYIAVLTLLTYQPCSLQGVLHHKGGISYLEASFTLRCFQRLSHPHFATQLCHWRDNWCTIGASIPVLSYQEQHSSNILRPRWIGTELSHDVLNPARVPL